MESHDLSGSSRTTRGGVLGLLRLKNPAARVLNPTELTITHRSSARVFQQLLADAGEAEGVWRHFPYPQSHRSSRISGSEPQCA
jgi:hypothetical protein